MKFKVEAECTPEEARSFLGLPDVSSLNEHLVEEMKTRLTANISLLQPEELMRNWMSFGGQAQEQFMRMMTTAAAGAGMGGPAGKR
ncbi:DUF6489 family protein [Caulobacter sp. S45]|uniref:DUF6489 family protein n=1 Tax=Caulobacter sp. S45 TaxID=1641861 RepID=UPI00131E42FA|nr:DUF6489 family protein [Caulobacter sp. S45]